jgi:hypothetical protein
VGAGGLSSRGGNGEADEGLEGESLPTRNMCCGESLPTLNMFCGESLPTLNMLCGESLPTLNICCAEAEDTVDGELLELGKDSALDCLFVATGTCLSTGARR